MWQCLLIEAKPFSISVMCNKSAKMILDAESKSPTRDFFSVSLNALYMNIDCQMSLSICIHDSCNKRAFTCKSCGRWENVTVIVPIQFWIERGRMSSIDEGSRSHLKLRGNSHAQQNIDVELIKMEIWNWVWETVLRMDIAAAYAVDLRFDAICTTRIPYRGRIFLLANKRGSFYFIYYRRWSLALDFQSLFTSSNEKENALDLPIHKCIPNII